MPHTSQNGSHAPEFPTSLTWFNTKPLSMHALRGRAVLIDFWTYSCVNCLRTLSYVREWHACYASKGLVVIGVHTPEFAFEADATHVAHAVTELQIEYPVVLDSQYTVWHLYANRATGNRRTRSSQNSGGAFGERWRVRAYHARNISWI
ncbi:redoxin family protein [Candidatus Uhrbacteria bacterium]|nr:redoxin family protein [Candidatus Uhrbacteria bacterium]